MQSIYSLKSVKATLLFYFERRKHMSICKGIAGKRGRNPKGIFIHNDAGSKNANKAYYKNWLPKHDLANGFAHYYVTSDGTLQAEDDDYMAWHCGQWDGNCNYLSIEVCQSMGDLTTFKKNEETALKLAAKLCKKYDITPSSSTIRLHKEVFATGCPHRSVEIHGGDKKTKEYFIKKIKEYMKDNTTSNTTSASKPVSTTQPATTKNTSDIVFTYAVQLADGTTLPSVKNLEDYAGIRGKKIANVAIKVNKGKLKYRVHVLGGKWLPYVTGYNWRDHNNGYAGNGKAIDAIQIIYTPLSGNKQKVKYRISPVNDTYYDYQCNNEKTSGQDGYAGCYGKAIDRLQITVK